MSTVRAAVVGAGAWGTALADLLARNGADVMLWAREPDVVADVNTRAENRRFLAGHVLAPTLQATGDLAAAVADRDLVLFARLRTCSARSRRARRLRFRRMRRWPSRARESSRVREQ